jgi:hypothetical protein
MYQFARWNALQVGLVAAEFVLGSGLLIGGQVYRWARWAAVLAFFLFFVVSLKKVFGGEKSCGCFGTFELAPAYTVVIDFVCISLLVAVKEQTCRVLRPSVALCACGIILTGIWLTTNSQNGIVRTGGRLLVNESRWVGKPIPVLSFLGEDAQFLASGTWVLFFYRPNCEKCTRELERFLQSKALGNNTVFVEVPEAIVGPESDRGSQFVLLLQNQCRFLRLSDEFEWWLATPLFVEVSDGIVTRTWGE